MRRVRDRADRQRGQSVFGNDALGLNAKRFTCRLVVLSGAAHA
jgi:hypothetical protein